MEYESKENAQVNTNYRLSLGLMNASNCVMEDLINTEEDTLNMDLHLDTNFVLLEIQRMKTTKELTFEALENAVKRFDQGGSLFLSYSNGSQSCRAEMEQIFGTIQDIRDCCNTNDNTLQQYAQEMIRVRKIIDNRMKNIEENLIKYEELFMNKRRRLTSMKAILLKHKKMYKENGKKRENFLQKTRRLRMLRNKYKNLKNQFGEYSKIYEDCRDKINEMESETREMEELLQDYKVDKDRLLMEMNFIEMGLQEHKKHFINSSISEMEMKEKNEIEDMNQEQDEIKSSQNELENVNTETVSQLPDTALPP